ncbi:PAS domain-containing protein [Rhodovulum sp. YEN HP10]|uniref:hybrid sensor histidine kinase/response regulator n=1 Tax=Rhodovulum sp. HP10 TaxID=3387397 RepID=UPI0039DF44DF
MKTARDRFRLADGTAMQWALERICAMLRVPEDGFGAVLAEVLNELTAVLGATRAEVLRPSSDGRWLFLEMIWQREPGPVTGAARIEAAALPVAWWAAFHAEAPLVCDDLANCDPAFFPANAAALAGIGAVLAVPFSFDARFGGALLLSGPAGRLLPEAVPTEALAALAQAIGSRLGGDGLVVPGAAVPPLSEAESRAASAVDTVMTFDDDGRVASCCSRRDRALADGLKGLAGKMPEDFLPPEEATRLRSALERCRIEGLTAPFPLRLPTRAGIREMRARAFGRAGADTAPDGAPAGLGLILQEDPGAEPGRWHGEICARAMETMSVPVVMADGSGRISWVNAAFERCTGFDFFDALGSVPAELLQIEMPVAGDCARLTAARLARRPARAEMRCRTRSGEVLILEVSIMPLFDAAGTCLGTVSTATDIAVHPAGEAGLALSEGVVAHTAWERLANAAEALPDGFACFDAEGRLAICNARFREALSMAGTAVVPGLGFREIFEGALARLMPRSDPAQRARWIAGRSEGRVLEGALRDGSWLRLSALLSPDGGCVVLCTDITALRREARRTREKLIAAMEASADGVAITDSSGAYLYMNRSFREMLGIGAGVDVRARLWQEFHSEEEAARIRAVSTGPLRSRGIWSGRVVARRADGEPVDQEVSVVRQADGCKLCICRDRSECGRRVRDEAGLREELQLVQRRQVIAQVTAGLMHDFNNLLATVSGSALLLRGGDDAERNIARILAASEQAGALVNRLASLEQRAPRPGLIDLRRPLEEAVSLVRAGAHDRLGLTLSLPREPMPAVADPTDVIQVFLNLLLNARDAICRRTLGTCRGEISVTAELAHGRALRRKLRIGQLLPDRRYYLLSVTDNGSGINWAVRRRLFEPYFSTKGNQGTGLGLSIVEGAVTENGGAIGLQSRCDCGTRFSVYWPVASAAPQDDARAAGPPCGRLAGNRILLADGDQDALRILSAYLETAGAEVAASNNPEDILEAVRSDPENWDLLVTDFDMPRLTGADLAAAVRRYAPGLPTLLVTAVADWHLRSGAACRDLFSGVLGKPVASADLIAGAVAAIGGRQTER